MLALIVIALVGLRVFAGVPRPEQPARHVSNAELAFLRAASIAFVPPVVDGLPRSGDTVDLVGFLDRYLGGLPPHQRRRIRAMLWFFEHSTLLLPARGPRGFRRFSKLEAEQQRALLESWAESRIGTRRALLTALRAFVIMGVMSDETNLHELGLAPWSDLASPTIETDLLYPEVGASRDSITLRERDLTPVRDVTPLRREGEGA